MMRNDFEIIDNFLRALYGNGEGGHLVIWTKADGSSYFFDRQSLHEAAQKAIALSVEMDVYFGVGLQKEALENGRGKAETVCMLPGLWVDVDVKGPNHKAINLPPDVDSAIELIGSFPLKPTIIVSTGGGFHAYWLFDHPFLIENDADRGRAKELSTKFQNTFFTLAKERGWKIDNTSAIASVLRLPGTLNHKQTPAVSVEIVHQEFGSRYAPSVIEDALSEYDSLPECRSPTLPGQILEGSRNTTLTRIAGSLRAQGMTHEHILDELRETNTSRCVPPLPESEVEQIARSVSSYDPPPQSNQGVNQSDRIMELISGLTLFHTPDQECYAEIEIRAHKEVVQVDSKEFLNYLLMSYYELHGNPPGPQVMNSVLSVVKARTLRDSPEKLVHLRVASHGGDRIYIDLCNDDRSIVEVTPDGWSIVDESPVCFRRARGMRPLPIPEKGGRVADLRNFINVNSGEQWIPIISWLVYAFRPQGPYPILILHGEQGSAKSTTAKILRELIDPSSSPLRAIQKGDREFMISAQNAWVIACDNLSGVSKEISDRLCRLSTGAGFSTRGLYTDSDEVIFNAARPIILNGIDDIANRNDLADRALIVNLPRITDEKRKTEEELWKGFETVKPRILGALLDAVSCGLRYFHSTSLSSKPRMADFAKWVVASEPKLPWRPGEFLSTYQANRKEAAMISFESNAVAMALRRFMEERVTWEGTTSDLKQQIEAMIENQEFVADKYWPKNPSQLSNRIRRVSPALRAAGVAVDLKMVRGERRWAIRYTEPEGVDGEM